MFLTAGNSPPFSDITDALRKEFNVIVLASDVPPNIDTRANADNPEFIKFSNKIKASNSSIVKSIDDGVR